LSVQVYFLQEALKTFQLRKSTDFSDLFVPLLPSACHNARVFAYNRIKK
jgi:hypothetical protein